MDSLGKIKLKMGLSATEFFADDEAVELKRS